MKSADKYLVAIVVSVVVLIVVAFSVALLRPRPTYLPEDTPESIANNYLFALQQDDFERAYGYLSPTIKGYPASVTAFTEDIRSYNWGFHPDERQSLPSLVIDSVKINKNRATISIRKTTFYAGGLFSSGEYRSTFSMRLIRNDNGVWKIESSDDYWTWCWDSTDGCK